MLCNHIINIFPKKKSFGIEVSLQICSELHYFSRVHSPSIPGTHLHSFNPHILSMLQNIPGVPTKEKLQQTDNHLSTEPAPRLTLPAGDTMQHSWSSMKSLSSSVSGSPIISHSPGEYQWVSLCLNRTV